MKYGSVAIGVALSFFAVAMPAAAQQVAIVSPATRAVEFMRIYGNSQPPYGFVSFCERMPSECVARSHDTSRLEATPERLSELDVVNRKVNHEIEPATDMEIYGVAEYWTIPKTRGDCEDYALLKRHILIARGWPSSDLLMTVVRDEKNEGHAVLTVRTTQGDYILDNKIDVVRLWNQTPYHYVMRQSYLDPKVWVSLDPNDATTPAASAGVESSSDFDGLEILP
ncbi:transglutaminase-like cysteine peptidase [Hyphomicrobium sp.]|jgi:predicted transglutaminase-like cysteine proteinase|uniref:transglutaminase-like cysteine peptidase n=1 Tax=Hyphomicrobium sp. TaxID=82 RepID=UPI002CE91FBB|nr:transglutaminase-like cysteine peptidase [Hyphomicrobium sp.]HVZ05339.1 transglutaminase-like cysteine peptidase [Hyphomicrobium sp.]